MSEQVDIYEERLNEQIKNLQECQQSHNLKSCYNCPKLLECEVRKLYVSAVYKSMNKGQLGDFNF